MCDYSLSIVYQQSNLEMKRKQQQVIKAINMWTTLRATMIRFVFEIIQNESREHGNIDGKLFEQD
jgi:hypothetical protein